jgi:hypothetical protein
MFLLGDTAFISTILGCDGHSPSGCNICWFKKAEWQMRGELGTPVTVKTIIDQVNLNMLKAGTLNPKDMDEVKGCKDTSLLTWQKQERTLVGVLHCVAPLGNTVMSNMNTWIHWRIEEVPEVITKCWHALATAMLEEEESQATFDTCKMILDSHVLEKEYLELVTNQTAADKQELKELTVFINGHRKEHTPLLKKLTVVKMITQAVCKAVNTVIDKKEHGTMTQSVCQLIDMELKESFHMKRCHCHDQDYEGGELWSMFAQAELKPSSLPS